LMVIDRRKQKLSEWRKRLEQMQYDLTARESRILESESFLPVARQLQTILYRNVKGCFRYTKTCC
ncbi:MAG: hypothetical protein WA323_00995, partial [Candidatus Nitrosopolaris sp.]